MVIKMNKEYISKSEFKARALEYLRRVESTGESIVITDHGKPAVEVRPYHSVEHSPLEALKGSVKEYVEPTKPVGHEDWGVAGGG
jgi:prevent-host-death family protein